MAQRGCADQRSGRRRAEPQARRGWSERVRSGYRAPDRRVDERPVDPRDNQFLDGGRALAGEHAGRPPRRRRGRTRAGRRHRPVPVRALLGQPRLLHRDHDPDVRRAQGLGAGVGIRGPVLPHRCRPRADRAGAALRRRAGRGAVRPAGRHRRAHAGHQGGEGRGRGPDDGGCRLTGSGVDGGLGMVSRHVVTPYIVTPYVVTPYVVTRYVVTRYVAIGDSSTEGLDDPDGAGGWRGWADRLAEQLAVAFPEVTYANLAVRGRLAGRVRAEQLPAALALRPDLATVVAGMNDVLRPGFDAERVAGEVEAMQAALVAVGATVLSWTLPDPVPVMPLARPLRRRVLALNDALRAAAARTGTILVDFGRHPVTSDPRFWSDDRLHANAAAIRALADALGLPGSDGSWVQPLPTA